MAGRAQEPAQRLHGGCTAHYEVLGQAGGGTMSILLYACAIPLVMLGCLLGNLVGYLLLIPVRKFFKMD